MVTPERLDGLQRSWVNLLAPFGVTPAAAYPAFDRLVEAYSEPHRHYHNLEHVGEVLRVVGRLSAGLSLADVSALQLAVWYHDAIYDPKAKDNEERSAAFADVELLGLLNHGTIRKQVMMLVESTAHFDPKGYTGSTYDILHDADLAILGASEVRYARYAADIHKEYAWVPDADYRDGRRKVLESFLSRERIYRTDVMFAEGEAAARRNLAGEVSALSPAAE